MLEYIWHDKTLFLGAGIIGTPGHHRNPPSRSDRRLRGAVRSGLLGAGGELVQVLAVGTIGPQRGTLVKLVHTDVWSNIVWKYIT